MRRRLEIGAVFLAVVVIVVLAAVGAGSLVDDGPPTPPPLETDQYEAAAVLPDPPAVGGPIRMSSNATGERIIVDTAHNNDVTDREIAPLVNVLSTNGHHLRVYDGVRLLSLQTALSKADAYIVVNPEESFTHRELDAIREFIDDGGRVMVAMDPGSRNALVAGQGNLGEATIFTEIGIERRQGFLYNPITNENNYVRVFAEPATPSPLTEGVDRVVLPGASPVDILHGRIALSTTAETRLSTTGGIGRHYVVAHDDSTVFVGDASFLAPENARHADNNVLIGNLADFLVEGNRTRDDIVGNETIEGNVTAPPATAAPENETSD